MSARDIIVIGASAGGVEAVSRLVSQFPSHLPAAVCLVIHRGPGPSDLKSVLKHSGPLPVEDASDGQALEHGRIYIAPADRHMLLEQDRIHLWRGPRENHHRPAINALFRSAAVAYGERVIGVVLSGVLDDGTTGLWWIKRHGGLAIVQDPADTKFPDMVLSAIEHVSVDHVVYAGEIGILLGDLVNGANRKLNLPLRGS